MAARRVHLKDIYAEARLYNRRAIFSTLLVVVLFCVLLGRYFTLQVLQHDSYRTQSERNRVQLQPIAPKRGLILDRNGELLAVNQPSYQLTVVKEQVGSLSETLDRLRQLLALTDDEVAKFERRLSRRRPYSAVPLRFNLSQEEIAMLAVHRHELPGVDVTADLVRHYPFGELFSHTIGYVGRINERESQQLDPVNYAATDHVGKLGLELHYEALLHGQVGYENVETNARGRVLRVLERFAPVPGRDLQLNIDYRLQQLAQAALGEERGSVVAIDPRNGGVLAMVSNPSFDANLFVTGISQRDFNALSHSPDLPLFNRSLQGQYPPGSTVKPMYGLAGLYYGAVTERTKVADPGWYSLPNDDRVFRDWKRGGHGHSIDLRYALLQSCDVYFYELANRLGIDRIYEFSRQFGLGSPTGIDVPHERGGLLPSRAWKRETRRLPWFPGETLNVGIGQGYMLATPLQLASMTATLAMRGEGYRPQLVRRIGDEQVTPEPLPPITGVSSVHWDYILQAMEDTVHDTHGTAHRISRGLTQYRMAGKTGTAQVISIGQDEQYDELELAKRKRDHALFVGYAPVSAPTIAIAVIVENGESGSGVAAPIARKLADFWMAEGEGMTHESR